jgi:hypothetical protein
MTINSSYSESNDGQDDHKPWVDHDHILDHNYGAWNVHGVFGKP